ncbi:MCE family protein [Rhodococcus sp. NPDC003318]|uniref:MCE family protein n=1 Tax=Rhodococcus sp. NPDC003318 TaxID=3364503 RepID=UPI00368BF3E4
MKLGWKPVAKLTGFCAAGVVSGVLVANTLLIPVQGDTASYTVEFSDIEGLTPGNPVTMAGVRIGRVDSIAFADAGGGTSKAVVGIEIEADHPLTTDVTAAVRYGDMLGARYVALSGADDRPVSATGEPLEGATTTAAVGFETLPPGSTIPMDRTVPPVDLTAMMNGFRPLFDALAPDQVNTLTRSFVETFSGQGQAMSTLLTQIGDLSSDLADRRPVFEQLVDNMAALLGSVDARSPQLEELLVGLGTLTSTIVGNSDQLVALLDGGNRAIADLARVMLVSNGAFGQSITDLKSVTDAWIAATPQFNEFVASMPEFGGDLNRLTSYGSFVNLYLCNLTLEAGDMSANLFGTQHSQVCQ